MNFSHFNLEASLILFKNISVQFSEIIFSKLECVIFKLLEFISPTFITFFFLFFLLLELLYLILWASFYNFRSSWSQFLNFRHFNLEISLILFENIFVQFLEILVSHFECLLFKNLETFSNPLRKYFFPILRNSCVPQWEFNLHPLRTSSVHLS